MIEQRERRVCSDGDGHRCFVSWDTLCPGPPPQLLEKEVTKSTMQAVPLVYLLVEPIVDLTAKTKPRPPALPHPCHPRDAGDTWLWASHTFLSEEWKFSVYFSSLRQAKQLFKEKQSNRIFLHLAPPVVGTLCTLLNKTTISSPLHSQPLLQSLQHGQPQGTMNLGEHNPRIHTSLTQIVTVPAFLE